MPVSQNVAAAIARWRAIAAVAPVVVVLLTCVVGGVFAQDTLRMATAIELAQAANPALQAARLRVDITRERISQAGALPDPVLSLGLMNRPLGGFGSGEPMTMNSVQLTQRLPWPGKLGFSRDREEHLALAQELDATEIERQLTARVASVYYELAFMDRALAVLRETRTLLRNFHEVSAARYAVGEGLQQDLLQAQVAVAQMTEEVTVMEQQRVAAAARLNALLGRDATVPVPALEPAGVSTGLPPVDSLMAIAVALRPALRAARARIDAAEAGYRAARRQLYPDLTVSAGYSHRPQFDDMASIMLGITVPLWAGRRQLPLRREMLAAKAEQEARERDLHNETFARITELRSRAERARALSDLYANSVLPQARAAVESALSAYRVGKVDYMTLVNNQLTVNRYEIESVRLAADFQQAVAELEALVGSDIGGIQ